MTKRLIGTVMATVFALASTWAVAEAPLSKAVQMTDAQLDEVTAAGAGASSGHLILNAGNANVFKITGDPSNPTFILCVNCSELGFASLESGPAMGMHIIFNNGHREGKQKCFGGFTGLGC